MLAHLQDLDPVNAEAWRIYQAVATRFSVEVGTGGVALERLTDGWDEDRFAELWRRLTVAFDVFNPLPEQTG